MASADAATLRLGISACVLGERVRYDGRHKREASLLETFGRFVVWEPVCPEVELGLGVPRPPVRLEGDPAAPRLVEVESGRDLSRAMTVYANRRAKELASASLDGFVLKSRSPSCGPARVPVHRRGAGPLRRGQGVFAGGLRHRLPLLPLEEEARLRAAAPREHFVERAFAYQRWRTWLASRPRLEALAAFHHRHRFALQSHSPARTRELDTFVAAVGIRRRGESLCTYGQLFMAALAVRATRRTHATVLRRGYDLVKTSLAPADCAELHAAIADYARGRLPRIVPLTLLKHYAGRHGCREVVEQTYISPGQPELVLRSGA